LAGVGEAFTATDYYNAGLQLYNAQNYSQAIQYFSAAISLDPNSAPALQGRANCYYSQGQYSQALADYQKVESITPSDALSQMIQSLQAKVGTGSNAAIMPSGNPIGPSSFDQGVSLYQQKQYPQAIPFFQQAVQQNPGDGKAYYYLGLSQVLAGQSKEACVNLTLSDQKLPNPQVKQYTDQLKAQLSPEDQQWVDGQLVANASVQTTPVVKTFRLKRSVRVSPEFLAFNLSDFEGSVTARLNEAKFFQLSDPSNQFTGSVPEAAPGLDVEGDYPLGPNFELGPSFQIVPVGTVSDRLQNNSGFILSDNFNIFAGYLSLMGRYFINQGDIKPWISGGPLVSFGYINYSYDRVQGGSTTTFNGPFAGIGLGGQAKVGADIKISDAFIFSVFAGYQLDSSNGYSGTIKSSTVTGVTPGATDTLMVVPTSKGNVIVPVSNGVLCLPTFDSPAGAPVPAGSRPAVLDLSGPLGGLSISYFF
jgi:tetratricopeptide (TPR) repeat protein